MKVANNSTLPAEDLLDPEHHSWSTLAGHLFRLEGTPAAMQPTAALRNTWADRSIGAITSVTIKAQHNSREIGFYLRWDDASQNLDHGDNSSFPDAAALAFPLHEHAYLQTMGSPGAALGIWFWKSDYQDRGEEIYAQGPGSTERIQDSVRCRALWLDGTWHVVLVRSLGGNIEEGLAQLEPGMSTKIGVAVWEGGATERGGFKSYSPQWTVLDIE